MCSCSIAQLCFCSPANGRRALQRTQNLPARLTEQDEAGFQQVNSLLVSMAMKEFPDLLVSHHPSVTLEGQNGGDDPAVAWKWDEVLNGVRDDKFERLRSKCTFDPWPQQKASMSLPAFSQPPDASGIWPQGRLLAAPSNGSLLGFSSCESHYDPKKATFPCLYERGHYQDVPPLSEH